MDNEKEENVKINYADWAVAYTAIMGPMQVGYMGRIEDETDGVVTLGGAIEFASRVSQGREGGLVRICNGMALEFTTTLHRVKVRYLAMVPLRNLSEKERGVYDAAYREATEAAASLRQTRGSDIITPVAQPKLVAPNGAPMGGAR